MGENSCRPEQQRADPGDGPQNSSRQRETWGRTVADLNSRGLTLEMAPRPSADRGRHGGEQQRADPGDGPQNSSRQRETWGRTTEG